MKKLNTYTLLLLTSAIAIGTIILPVNALAFNGSPSSGAESARAPSQPTDLFGTAGIFNTITNIMLYVIGAVAVIMIVIGGLRYVISGGDSKTVEAAKNTILYAVIGIIVALLAYAVVDFVVNAIAESGGGGGAGASKI